MGQIGNILDGGIATPTPLAQLAPQLEQSNLARLIPGGRSFVRRRIRKHGARFWFSSDEISACGASLCTVLLVRILLQFSHVKVPRAPLLLAVLMVWIIALLGRRALRALAAESADSSNVLIVGNGVGARIIHAEIGKRAANGRSVEVISETEFNELCASGEFATFARERFIDEVVIASPDVDFSTAIRESRRLQLDLTVSAYAVGLSAFDKIAVEEITGETLIGVHREHAPAIRLSAKRAIDVAVSGIGLVLVSPVLMIVTLLIQLDSAGPVLYRARRVGHKGREFICYKFRTMVMNAEASKKQLRNRNERSGAFFKISDDPRITRVGKFLRRHSLDELPQLWNVLRGEMSLVGPRPHPKDDVELYGVRHLQRLDFLPGITGLWQVTARRDPSFERSVALDVEYINNWSLWLDFQILCRTLGVVVRGSGV